MNDLPSLQFATLYFESLGGIDTFVQDPANSNCFDVFFAASPLQFIFNERRRVFNMIFTGEVWDALGAANAWKKITGTIAFEFAFNGEKVSIVEYPAGYGSVNEVTFLRSDKYLILDPGIECDALNLIKMSFSVDVSNVALPISAAGNLVLIGNISVGYMLQSSYDLWQKNKPA